MKQTKFSLLAAVAALCLTALLTVQCTQTDSQHFRIKGHLTDAKDSLTISITDLEKGSLSARDTTIAVSNGAFDVTLPVDNISFIQIFNKLSNESNIPEGLALFAVPGEKLTIEGSFSDSCRFGGSDFYRQYNEVMQAIQPFQHKLAAIGRNYNQLAAKATVPEEKMEELMKQERTISDQRTKAILAFAKAHPDNEASIAFLLYLDEESGQELIKALSPEIRNGRFKKLIQTITSPKRETEETQKASKQEGATAPDFTLRDINGQSFTLSSLRGKYVILDFWGSWCGWCIKGIPAMKEAYNKYKGKMEIVGIDCQDSEADWKKTVKEHAMPWIQVANGTGSSDAIRLYGVEGFPTKVIIDPAGKILKVTVGEDPAFYDYLKNVLAN